MAFTITTNKKLMGSAGNSSETEKRGWYVEAACLSTDMKQTEDYYATGSICLEVDTGKVFFYNATGKTWVEQFSFKG